MKVLQVEVQVVVEVLQLQDLKVVQVLLEAQDQLVEQVEQVLLI